MTIQSESFEVGSSEDLAAQLSLDTRRAVFPPALTPRLHHVLAYVQRTGRSHAFSVSLSPASAESLSVRVEPGANSRVSIQLQVVTVTAADGPAAQTFLSPDVLQAALAATNDSVMMTEVESSDSTGPTISYVNEAFTRMTGYATDEAINRTPRFLQGKNTDPNVRRRIREALNLWQPVRAELINYRKDGSEFWVELDIVPIADETGWFVHWVSVQRNVTERRHLEQARLATSRAESLNLLAGGIAHDFNNALANVSASTSLLGILIERGEPAERVQQVIADIDVAVRHASGLTHQLTMFAKGGTNFTVTLDLSKLVESTLQMVADLRSADVQLQLEDGALVEGDETQLQQVIVNLVLNALDATPERGRIRISVEIEASDGSASPNARLTIADSGAGIPTELLPRVFEPYFTTKERGTGLGLAVVHSVVQKHGGRISVDSVVGVGTTFTVRLPLSSGSPRIPRKVTPSGAPTPAGRVLVVDDNALLTSLVVRLVSVAGYSAEGVHTAQAATEACQLAQESGSPFTLAIVDIVLGRDGSGIDLANELRHDHPRLQLALMTGYSQEAVRDRELPSHLVGFLKKPFTAKKLDGILRTAHAAQRGEAP